MSDVLSATFAALADPTRRALIERLSRGEATVGELAEPHSISLPAISRHLAVLESAGLVTKSRSAQWRRCHLEPERLREIDAWLSPYRRFFETRLDRLERQLAESEPDLRPEDS